MRRIAPTIAAALLVAACGGTTDDPASAGPQELVDEAASVMATITSSSFTMERSGAPVEIEGMVFESARGEYAAPDSARAILSVRAGDLAVKLGTIAIGDRVWLTNPLTGAWEQLARGSGFNPAIVFDPHLGWVPLLTEDLTDLRDAGAADGARVVRGVVAASRVEFLTAGLVEAQSVEADIHIDADGGHIVRVEFTTGGETGESEWVIELGDFDAPVTIQAPAGS